MFQITLSHDLVEGGNLNSYASEHKLLDNENEAATNYSSLTRSATKSFFKSISIKKVLEILGTKSRKPYNYSTPQELAFVKQATKDFDSIAPHFGNSTLDAGVTHTMFDKLRKTHPRCIIVSGDMDHLYEAPRFGVAKLTEGEKFSEQFRDTDDAMTRMHQLMNAMPLMMSAVVELIPTGGWDPIIANAQWAVDGVQPGFVIYDSHEVELKAIWFIAEGQLTDEPCEIVEIKVTSDEMYSIALDRDF